MKNVVCGLLVSTVLGGCTVMDTHTRVPDWPELKAVEHHVSHSEMRERCARFAGPFMSPLGCTLFYFDRAEAHIYVSKELASQMVLEHERLHAAGYDHIGSDAMKRMLENWKARITAASASR